MLKFIWFAFVFRSILSPIQRYQPIYNTKYNDSAINSVNSLKPALTRIISPSEAKERIDSYLTSAYSKFSRTYITELINNGNVYVNNTQRKPSYRLKAGDVVQIVSSDLERRKSRGANLSLDILYEDDYMMVINKAPGMVVHPGAGCPNETVANAVEFYINNKTTKSDVADTPAYSEDEDYATTVLDSLQSPESYGNHIVHRLDKGSSGVLLIGKNRRMTNMLSDQFASRDVVKYYLAVCVGNPGDTTIAKAIGRSATDRQKMAVTNTVGQGKPAVSHVVSLLFDGQLSVAMVRIDTGRTHQIRVHMNQRRTPILGDEQYGSSRWNRQLTHHRQSTKKEPAASGLRTQLHAYETHFTHPVTGERLSVRAPLPADIRTLINRIAMKNICSSAALPLFFFSQNRTDESKLVRSVPDRLPDILRDSEKITESSESNMQRKLIGVVNKTSGLLQGNTDFLYAGLQSMSDNYRQQQGQMKGERRTVSPHGYVGSKGFYVAEDAIPSPATAAAVASTGSRASKGVSEEDGDIDLDEVWGVYEEDEGGRDGHRVDTRERSIDDSYGDEEDEEDTEEYEEEDEVEEGVEERESDDDEEEKEGVIYYDEDDVEFPEDDEKEEEGNFGVKSQEEDESDDWSVEDIVKPVRRKYTSEETDNDDDDNDEVDFSAVKYWR